MLGLPDSISAALFDLDGVLTDTAEAHRQAWAATFDPVLSAHGQRAFERTDYEEFVDGRTRVDGVRTFLASRHLPLPEGRAGEATEALTVQGLAARKNEYLLSLIDRGGVAAFPGSRRYLDAARAAGLRRVVVSSSANTAAVLTATGLAPLVEGRVDAEAITAQHLRGKPAPDAYLAGARLVGAQPSAAAVFEDATVGVEAGRAGAFGFVVGVNRHDDAHARELLDRGADIVVRDLGELL